MTQSGHAVRLRGQVNAAVSCNSAVGEGYRLEKKGEDSTVSSVQDLKSRLSIYKKRLAQVRIATII